MFWNDLMPAELVQTETTMWLNIGVIIIISVMALVTYRIHKSIKKDELED